MGVVINGKQTKHVWWHPPLLTPGQKWTRYNERAKREREEREAKKS